MDHFNGIGKLIFLTSANVTAISITTKIVYELNILKIHMYNMKVKKPRNTDKRAYRSNSRLLLMTVVLTKKID